MGRPTLGEVAARTIDRKQKILRKRHLGRPEASLMTPTEAAAILGVSPEAVKMWIYKGRLTAAKDPRNGYWWIRMQDLQEYQKKVHLEFKKHHLHPSVAPKQTEKTDAGTRPGQTAQEQPGVKGLESVQAPQRRDAEGPAGLPTVGTEHPADRS